MSKQKGYDEVFCASCGEMIKKQAEICPHCGVRNKEHAQASSPRRNDQTLGSRVDDIDQSVDIDVDKLVKYGLKGLAWIFGILFLLAGLGSLFSGAGIIGFILSFVQGILFILVGAILLPPVRARISIEYPLTTVGWTQSTGEAVIRNAETPCSVCYDTIEKGVARTYREQFVLFGVPISTREEGTNNYCQDCAGGEPSIETTTQELEQM